MRETRSLPSDPGEHPVFAPIESPAPSPLRLRVSPFPNVLESEPNNRWQDAGDHEPVAPIACNGIISEDGDIDWFAFSMAKDQRVVIQVYARRLASPLDPVIQLRHADGKHIKTNDDQGGPDGVIQFKAPREDRYLVSVRDHLKLGGPDYVYRVEITPEAPSLSIKLPEFDRRRPQKRQTIIIPRGNRFAAPFTAQRENLEGPVNVEFGALPEGVTLRAPEIDFNSPHIPVVFEAATNAPLTGLLTRVTGVHRSDGQTLRGPYRQAITMVKGNPNNAIYHQYEADRIAVAVAEEIPFSLRIEPPKAPLIHGGSLSLQVVVERKEGWEEPVHLKMLYNPAGITSDSEVKVAKNKDRASYRINASGAARVGLFPLAVVGRARVKGGEVWASTSFMDVDVTTPWIRGTIDLMTVEQGGEGEITCSLETLRPFEGDAKATILGLPPHTSAEVVTVSSDTKEAVFAVKAETNSKTGKHESLFCAIDIPYQDTVIPHTVGAFGTLRIDPPPKEEMEPQPLAKAAPEKPPAKKLSRLEALRKQRPDADEGGT